MTKAATKYDQKLAKYTKGRPSSLDKKVVASIVATAERISEVVGSSSSSGSGSSEVDSSKEISVVKSQLEATKDTITALKNDTRATGLVGDGGYVRGSGGFSAEWESGASSGSLRANSSSKKGCSNTTIVTISSSSSSGSGSDGGGDGGDGALGGWPSSSGGDGGDGGGGFDGGDDAGAAKGLETSSSSSGEGSSSSNIGDFAGTMGLTGESGTSGPHGPSGSSGPGGGPAWHPYKVPAAGD